MDDLDRLLSNLRPASKAVGTDEEVIAVVAEAFGKPTGITPEEAYDLFERLIGDLYDHRLADEHKEGLAKGGSPTKIERLRGRILSDEQATRLLDLEPPLRKDADFGKWDRTRMYLSTGETVKSGRLELDDMEE